MGEKSDSKYMSNVMYLGIMDETQAIVLSDESDKEEDAKKMPRKRVRTASISFFFFFCYSKIFLIFSVS